MPHIDYYFVTLSPWTYLAGSRLEEIAEKHGASVTYKPCDLGRVFKATGGLPLGERAQARRDYRMQELRHWRAALGMDLTLEPRISRPTRRPQAMRSSQRRRRAAAMLAS